MLNIFYETFLLQFRYRVSILIRCLIISMIRYLVIYIFNQFSCRGSSSTYTIQARGWLIITMKDNKTIEIVFLKNESRTMIIFVSESQSQNMSILGRSLPIISELAIKQKKCL